VAGVGLQVPALEARHYLNNHTSNSQKRMGHVFNDW
jgi:hypothetical protein